MSHEIDELMRGMKITVSFSCPSGLLHAIEEFRMIEFLNTSKAIVKLIRLGITYRLLLAEQKRLKQEESAKPKRKKKVKPKTHSKKK